MQYLITFCSRPEIAGDVILGGFVWPIDPDKPVKFCDPRSNLSQEIPHEAVGGSIFYVSFQDNFRPEVVSDVISGVVVDPADVKVFVKFGDSVSNRSRDKQLPQMCDEQLRGHWRAPVIT